MDPLESLWYFALACVFVLWLAAAVVLITGVITG